MPRFRRRSRSRGGPAPAAVRTGPAGDGADLGVARPARVRAGGGAAGRGLRRAAEAEEHGILCAEDCGVRFRHEIARMATEASLSGLQRRQLQRDVTELLKRRGEGHLPRLVHHAIRCHDTATVVEFAPRAGELSAKAGAHRQALDFYQAALQHEILLSDAQLAGVLDAYAWELYSAHQIGQALEHSARAVEPFHSLGDEPGEARALIRRGRQLFLAGKPPEARACASRAVELTEGHDPATAAEALACLGMLLSLGGSHEEAVRTLHTARARRPETSGRPDVVALCLDPDPNAVRPGTRPREAPRRPAPQHGDCTGRRRAGAAGPRLRQDRREPAPGTGLYRELDAHLDEGLPSVRDWGFWPDAYNLEVHHARLRSSGGVTGDRPSASSTISSRVPPIRVCSSSTPSPAGPGSTHVWDGRTSEKCWSPAGNEHSHSAISPPWGSRAPPWWSGPGRPV